MACLIGCTHHNSSKYSYDEYEEDNETDDYDNSFTEDYSSIEYSSGSSWGYDSDDDDSYVWICTGPYAYAYHEDPDCWQLDNCSEDIEEVTLWEAENDYSREPCSECCY